MSPTNAPSSPASPPYPDADLPRLVFADWLDANGQINGGYR